MRYVPIPFDEILRETALAFLFVIEGEELWVPKSVIENPDTIDADEVGGEVWLAEWFSKKEGLSL